MKRRLRDWDTTGVQVERRRGQKRRHADIEAEKTISRAAKRVASNHHASDDFRESEAFACYTKMRLRYPQTWEKIVGRNGKPHPLTVRRLLYALGQTPAYGPGSTLVNCQYMIDLMNMI